MKIRFLYKSLFINNSKGIIFPLGIRGLIQLDGLVLVFIYGATTEEMKALPTRNVYAFNGNGEQIWQIQEPIQEGNSPVSYADMSLRKDGKVIIGSTKGDEYILNIQDGSVEHIKGRRPW